MFNPGLTLTGFRTTKISQSAREKLDIYQSYCKKGYFDQFKALKKKQSSFWMCQIFSKSTWKWKFHVITFHVLRFIFTLLLLLSLSLSLLLLLLSSSLLLLLLLLLLFSLCWKSVYYAAIMLDASTITLCPQLCRHCLISNREGLGTSL